MSLLERYHLFVHRVASIIGYNYDDSAPEWIRPFVHLILTLAPSFLLGVLIYLGIRFLLSSARSPRKEALPELVAIQGAEPNLFKAVLAHSLRPQLIMIALSLTALPILYATLELPKLIVNNALDSNRFPVSFIGWEFDQVSLLMLLCGLYLVAIFASGLNKYVLNTFKGFVSERFLRRLRLAIYRHWRFREHSSETRDVFPVLAQEVEPIGGFAANLLTLPVLQGGTLLTIMLFMFVQDPLLGAAALSVLPIQIILLPKLQRHLNRLARTRIHEVRALGTHLRRPGLASAQQGHEIRSVAASLKELERIRRRIFRLKFFVKALNNFLTSLTPFLFYSLGGYFVIEGRISLGALVAVLAAHKDFSAPLKDLFAYYQQVEDSRIRYKEIFLFFRRHGDVVKPTTTGKCKALRDFKNEDHPLPCRRMSQRSGANPVC